MQLDEDFDCCLAIESQFCMVVNFGDVDKVESAANFCKWPLALYREAQPIYWRLTDATTTHNGGGTSILSPGSMCQSVIFVSLTSILGKGWFFKSSHWPCHAHVSRDNWKLTEDSNQNCGKIDKNQTRIILLFATSLKSTNRVELSYSWQRASRVSTRVPSLRERKSWLGRQTRKLPKFSVN